MDCCEGKPISKLPRYVSPYLGSEEFAFVQDNETRAGALSSFITYFSDVLVTTSELAGLSGDWQDTYNIVIPGGGADRWDSVYNLSLGLSSRWENTYSTVYSLSDTWNDDKNVIDEFQAASPGWTNTQTIVQLNSSFWGNEFDSSALQASSGNWESVYNTVYANSAAWDEQNDTLTAISNASADWNSAYTTVNNNSAFWDEAYTTVITASCAWDDVFVSLQCTEEGVNVPTGSVYSFRIPYDVDIVQVRASVSDAPVGDDIIIDVTSDGNSIFNNFLYINDGSKTSVGSSPAFSLNSFATITDDSEIIVNVNNIGSTTPGAGLKVTLIGNRDGCIEHVVV